MVVGEWLTSWQRDYIGNVKRGTTVNYELHLRLYISPLIGWGTVSVCGSIIKPAPVACNGSKATGLIVPFSAVHDILTGRRDGCSLGVHAILNTGHGGVHGCS